MSGICDEPIEALIERSSLGARRVRILAEHAPKELVDQVLERLAETDGATARDPGLALRYSDRDDVPETEEDPT